jgi:RNA polymerase sigma factor (TIGR02999 family)
MPDLKEDASPQENQPTAVVLPELYARLRRLAAALTARLGPGQTLHPTALVHQAYLRLMGHRDPRWEGRPHFFRAAARDMREILIEQARRKGRLQRGGAARRVERRKDESRMMC